MVFRFCLEKAPDNQNPPITENQFRSIESNPWHVHHETVNEIERLRQQYQFFHWHLEFPDVFLLPEENQKRKINIRAGMEDLMSCFQSPMGTGQTAEKNGLLHAIRIFQCA